MIMMASMMRMSITEFHMFVGLEPTYIHSIALDRALASLMGFMIVLNQQVNAIIVLA
jgi:hypothetical protein